jgi:hypothetical protein
MLRPCVLPLFVARSSNPYLMESMKKVYFHTCIITDKLQHEMVDHHFLSMSSDAVEKCLWWDLYITKNSIQGFGKSSMNASKKLCM